MHCIICTKIVSTNLNLKTHMKLVHDGKNKTKPMIPGNEFPICNKKFALNRVMNKHIKFMKEQV